MNQTTRQTARIITLFVVLFVFTPVTHAQIWEDFSDGDFTSNPTWIGDTQAFRINSSRQLQVYTDHADTVQLTFPFTLPADDTVVWEAWLKVSFAPTANNYAMLVLYADNSELMQANRWLALAVSDPTAADHRIGLYQDGQLLLQLPYAPRNSTNPLRFKLRMIDRQQFDIWIDTIGSVDSIAYAYAGSASAVATVPESAHFGLLAIFTSSRAHHFYLDDIGINKPEGGSTPHHLPVLHPGDILVNEILFNPEPGGADYVELANNSDSAIALSQLRLAKVDGSEVTRLYAVADSGHIAPGEYLVITTDADYVTQHYTVRFPARLVEVSSMPAYNDDAGSVVVTTADTLLLDRFDYSEKMHSPLLRDKEGVALERRSLQSPTQESSNWYSAASTAGFGTPTYTNSQSREFLFLDNDFHIENTLFSPDGDGYNDLIDITYSLQQCDLSCHIDIYDAHGRLVRHLLQGALLGCEGVITWDGTDLNGKRCQRGNYIVVVEAYNTNGTRQSWRRRVSLVTK